MPPLAGRIAVAVAAVALVALGAYVTDLFVGGDACTTAARAASEGTLISTDWTWLPPGYDCRVTPAGGTPDVTRGDSLVLPLFLLGVAVLVVVAAVRWRRAGG